MINHDHKCIFVHINRTAGTSIEQWICGSDWWDIEKETKHILASQAKVIYKDYWDDYFKFAFVRNPVDRALSCLKFRDYFGLEYDDAGNLNFEKYFDFFGKDVILEFDHRFYEREKLITDKHQTSCVYSNILDEELDFIGKYENLKADTFALKNILGIKHDFNYHAEKSDNRPSPISLNENSKSLINKLYEKDIATFGY